LSRASSSSQTTPKKSKTSTSEGNRDLIVLNAIAAQLNGAADVQAALEETLALVTELLGLRTGWVWLLDPDTDQFYNAASHNLPPYLRKPIRMAGSWCVCTESFRSGKLAPKNIDVIECSRLAPAVRSQSARLTGGLRYHASIPLYSGKKPLGIMNLTGPAWRKLKADELRLLSTIGYQVGVTIERARLAEESAQLAREEERSRVAREIHDTLVQSLTAISLQLDAALNQIGRVEATPTDPSAAVDADLRQRISRARDVAREGLEEARRSVLELRGAPPAGKSLAPALRALARGFTSQTGIRVRVRATGRRQLRAEVETELYRIAQEALTNVHKHAGVNEAEVSLRVSPRTVSVQVRDRGRGFSRAGSTGQGLTGMRERARALGGVLDVDSAPGRGTTISANVPA